MRTYSSLEVSALTGVSLRQLQWWDEQGVVTPLQKGHRRIYTRLEVFKIGLVIGLRKKGLSLQKARGVLRKFVRAGAAEYLESDRLAPNLCLLTDGDVVFVESTNIGIIRVLRKAEQPLIAVFVSDVLKKLRAEKGFKKPVQSATSRTGERWARVRKAS